MPNARIFLILVAASVAAAGCGARNPRPAGPSTGRVITAEEIASSGVKNAWEAIRYHFRHLSFTETTDGRPSEMTSRGRSSLFLGNGPMVLVDGAQISTIDVLEAIPASQLQSMEWLPGVEGTAVYGTNAGNGVIRIVTWHGPAS